MATGAPTKCAACGAAFEPLAKFCGSCGTRREPASSPPKPACPSPKEFTAELPARPVQGDLILSPKHHPPAAPAQWEPPPVPAPAPPPFVQQMQFHPQPAGPTSAPQQQNVNVYVTHPHGMQAAGESNTFALITLLCYFVFWPLGALLNVVGLITGPKRGCFAAMFFLILLPIVLLIGLVIVLIATGAMEELARELERAANQP